MQRGFERMVIPVAGHHDDSRVLDILPDLLRKDGGHVTFLFVVEVPQAMPLDAELPTDIEAGERALRHAESVARQTLPARTTHIVTELLQARAIGPAIVDEAIERGADAIAMTASIHRKHGRDSLGDTTNYVLLNAPCEVIVIRSAPEEPDQR